MSRLLTWLHVSDIHFGDGTRKHRFDKSLVLERLLDDVEWVQENLAVVPDVLFITGDIAFSAATKSATEYTDARSWIARLLSASRLTADKVYTTPGNHDADLSKDNEDKLRYPFWDALRRGGDASLDNLDDQTRGKSWSLDSPCTKPSPRPMGRRRLC